MKKYRTVNLLADTYDNPFKSALSPFSRLLRKAALDNFNNELTEAEHNALPAEQAISVDSISFNTKTSKFKKEAVHSMLGTLDIADAALTSSILSAAIYERNIWTIKDSKKDLNEMTVRVEEAMRDKDALYNLKIWHFIKGHFTKIPDKELNIGAVSDFFNSSGKRVAYSFKDGQYSALKGLAHATILKSPHPSGEGDILHVVFRGTEFEKLPAYIRKAYPDIPAYYEAFQPFVNAIQEYANDPKNNIKEVHATGHSLGGAMAQQCIADCPETTEGPKYRGFTFGSPGAKKQLLFKFLSVGYHLVAHGRFKWDKPHENDHRMHEFYHDNDPIPKIGLIGYQRSGLVHNLFDHVYEESKRANLETKSKLEKLPVFGKLVSYFKEYFVKGFQVRFHDSKRYTLNLRALIENYYKAYPNLSDKLNTKTYGWQHYILAEEEFKSLGSKYKTAFNQFFARVYPELDTDSSKGKELIKSYLSYETEAREILAKTEKETFEPIKHISDALMKLNLDKERREAEREAKIQNEKLMEEFPNLINFNKAKQNILELRKKAEELNNSSALINKIT